MKVHHKPGGASNFSLAHDDGTDDRWGNSGKVGAPSNNNQAAGAKPNQQSTSPWGTEEEAKKEDAPNAGPGSFTSVKYSGNPPGGKSSITF